MSRINSTVEFHLPTEITIEILSRLPVKPLWRFTSVSKTWYALIKSPDFIHKHLTRSIHTSLIIDIYNYKTRAHGMSLLSNDALVDLDFPFLNGRNYVSVVGICNGLFCISLSRFGYPLFLCNPATRQFRQIPHYERLIDFERVSFGFGFHPSANDYKLIRIAYYYCLNGIYVVRAELYAMSSDSWREIDVNMPSFCGRFLGDVPSKICGDSASAVLNGVIYWGAYVLPFNDLIVLSFDMDDETLGEVRTPRCFDRIWLKTSWELSELYDKLALFIYSEDDRCFCVWFLDENRTSWTKQFKVGPFPRIPTPVGGEENGVMVLVGCAKNGELVVAEKDCRGPGDLELFFYVLKSQAIKNLHVCLPYRSMHTCGIYQYNETLLPVK